MVTKAKKAKVKVKVKVKKRIRRVIDPKRVAVALRWYRGGEDRSLRQACAKFKGISFESLRRAALAGRRRG